jgi:prepilin-type N-terminal cleavage/methylation domain-containing protein
MESSKDKAFTLIELLVVIAIIGILAGMVLVSMSGARSKARDARRLSDMRQLVSAQEMYYGENDSYFISATYPDSIGTYLSATPNDPSGGTAAYGTIDNTGTDEEVFFCYFAELENPNITANGCGNTDTTDCDYYTASEGGNFYKTIEPTNLGVSATPVAADCSVQM